VLLVGTAGLAGRLASSARRDDAAAVLDGRAVLAIGSFAPTALGQVAAAVRAGIPHVRVAAAPAASGRQARALLRDGHVLLTPGPQLGSAAAQTVVGLLAQAVSEAADAADVLVLSGGHTAQVVLDRLGVPLLELVAELEPGVVASRIPGRRQLVVTKAGAFGDEATLVRLLHRSTAPRSGRSVL
jgi:D-threonate/D-erythronate kinase